MLGIAHNTVRGFYRQRATDWQAIRRIAGRLLTTDGILRLEDQLDASRKTREAIEPTDSHSPDIIQLAHPGTVALRTAG